MSSLKEYNLTEKDCVYLVKLARKTLEEYFNTGEKVKCDYEKYPGLMQPMGAFVTLKTYPDNELRGCIGYPKPVMSLGDAVIDNALSAAFSDPRFPQLNKNELGHVTVEVSILTPPKKIEANSPEDYLKKIKIGKHGLFIHYGSVSGLLLPQVPVEYHWNVREYLEALCQKAGLPKNMWMSPTVIIESFSAFVYGETKPKGRVKRVKLIQ